jgi:hypothetical protein
MMSYRGATMFQCFQEWYKWYLIVQGACTYVKSLQGLMMHDVCQGILWIQSVQWFSDSVIR